MPELLCLKVGKRRDNRQGDVDESSAPAASQRRIGVAGGSISRVMVLPVAQQRSVTVGNRSVTCLLEEEEYEF